LQATRHFSALCALPESSAAGAAATSAVVAASGRGGVAAWRVDTSEAPGGRHGVARTVLDAPTPAGGGAVAWACGRYLVAADASGRLAAHE
jgi:hypothetical protein